VELARSDWAGGRFEWESPEDSSGIRGFSWACDRLGDTAPPETVAATPRQSGPESSVAGEFQPGFPSGGGKWYFHLRAVDGAGNWGATSHCEVDYGEVSPGNVGRDAHVPAMPQPAEEAP